MDWKLELDTMRAALDQYRGALLRAGKEFECDIREEIAGRLGDLARESLERTKGQ